MKNLIIAAALTLSLTAFAEDPQTDVCDQLNIMAEAIMEARQSGVEMRDMIRITREENMPGYVTEIIIRAYEMPRFSVERNKQNAIKDFQNEIYLQCIRETV